MTHVLLCTCRPDDDVPAARMPSQSQPSFSRSSAPNLARSSSSTGSPMRRGHQPPQQPPPDPALITARLGAEAALKAVCVRFGAGLFEQLPSVWQHMAAALEAAPGPDGAPGGDLQGLIHAVQVGSCCASTELIGLRVVGVIVVAAQEPLGCLRRVGLCPSHPVL